MKQANSVEKQNKTMNLSVIIPCYNEINSIEKVVQSVLEATNSECEIIIVDDGSSDGTAQLLSESVDGKFAKVIYQPRNQGKGAALRKGFAAATKDIVIVQDADFEYDPKDYPLMIEPIVNDRADVVYGSRFKGNRPQRVLYFWHRMGNGLLTLMSNMFTNLNLTDMETGYKAFRREVIQSLTIEENQFGFEPEITAKIARGHYRIYEVGIAYFGRTYTEGKKIDWKDGLWAIWCILKYNLRRQS
jgi:glycosyltransferase involved in cell wall biosynthesis